MVSNQEIFEEIFIRQKKQLPFVVFRKPHGETLHFIGQSDNKLNYTSSFEEEGFVFAPFNDLSKTVILKPETYLRSDYVNTCEKEHDLHPESDMDIPGKEDHVKLVTEGITAIHKGKLNKVVLSRSQGVMIDHSSYLSIYKTLLNTYKNAFAYWWYHPQVGMWMGASPETLVLVHNSHFQTMSLAGTQRFKGTLDVSWGEKEATEQQIVTDYIAENLSFICATLNVSEVETVRAGNLLHLKTEISGVFKKGCTLRNLIEALHPTPAVCGYPKVLAKEFIVKHEQYERTYYTGFLGYINDKKEGTSLYVNLRCMELNGNKAIVYVGGGVTKDSDPEAEWEETLNKSLTMMRLLK